jgi:hypothetical protein
MLLQGRFHACAQAGSVRMASPARRYQTRRVHQRGFCDVLDCGGCIDAGDVLGCAGDACSCDWPWKKRERSGPDANRNDHLNNENALRERVRRARERGQR